MGKIETVMREEIARLARRELKSTVDPLRKDVRELKRTVRSLEKTVARLDREASKAGKARQKDLAELTADEKEVKAARINGRWVQSLRSKLNVSQSELALLLGISVSGVRTWEYEISKPRGKNRVTLVALRKLGRRDVKKLLEQKQQ